MARSSPRANDNEGESTDAAIALFEIGHANDCAPEVFYDAPDAAEGKAAAAEADEAQEREAEPQFWCAAEAILWGAEADDTYWINVDKNAE